MRRTVIALAATVGALPAAAAAGQGASRPECSTILPRQVTAGRRALTPEDLARLRDIGPIEPEYFAEPFFTVSPDGRRVAFQLRQGDPQRNVYCLAMVIVDLSRSEQPRIIDEGGEPLLYTFDDFRGFTDFPTGLMRVVTPRWSADGKWIAFLKHSGGTTQVWRAFLDGSGSAPLTHSETDVVDFRFSPDRRSIVYATRPGVEAQRRQYENEGLDGWHYDERFVPWLSKHPLPRAPVSRQITVLDIASGAERAPTPQETSLVAADHQIIANSGEKAAIDAQGLEIAATNLGGGAKAGAFHARRGDGYTATCTAPACDGAYAPWWMPDRTHVRFFRSEGWAKASTAIYDWNVGSGQVRRLYFTDDVLSSCTPQDGSLLCLVDSSLQPRRLVRLDPSSGAREILFDPNPEFAHLTLGRPERLHWRNAFGVDTIADLVLPVGYQPGKRYPMVVVQYDTRGFLRGGTDDEYPIQAFANRGYAVLSFRRPASPATKGAKDYEEAGRKDLEQFTDRRSVQSSLERGVRIAIDRGIADPGRIGITGLSDGTSTVEWALIHSSIFSAAAVSSCCWDLTFTAMAGPSFAKHFLAEGYPGVLGRDDLFWKDVALEVNARRISAPILINASEDEFLTAVETYTALREASVPVDMFEYPSEHHARWQPAHRLATYRRSLDWFDYWLRGVRSEAPDRQSELKEWDRLRAEAAHRKDR
ncbi:MAG: Atxe2 family lasso peptide isopeptidase [Bacillota bacterium]